MTSRRGLPQWEIDEEKLNGFRLPPITPPRRPAQRLRLLLNTRHTNRYRAVLCFAFALVATYFYLWILPRQSFDVYPKKQRRDHPITVLMESARARWDAKLRRQSKTFRGAVNEYRRRYHMEPPKDFDKWYAFATKSNFKLIDEFDAIHDDLSPFFHLSSAEIRRRTRTVGLQETTWTVAVEGGQASTVEEVVEGGEKQGYIGRAYGLGELMAPFVTELPDLVFAANGLAEAIVYVPWEASQPHNASTELSDVQDYVSKTNAYSHWDKYVTTCPPASPVRQRPNDYRFPDALPGGLPPRRYEDPQADADDGSGRARDGGEQVWDGRYMRFMNETDAYRDFCNEADEFYEFGHFYCGWSTINEVAPVFGPGKAPGSMDIRIPSSFYIHHLAAYTYGYNYQTQQGDDEDEDDPDWEDKIGQIYWRGRTIVGGASTPKGRYPYHPRQRLIQLANQDNPYSIPVMHRPAPIETDGVPDPQSQSPIPGYSISNISVNKLRVAGLDAALTEAIHCDEWKPDGCEGMARDYRITEAVPLYDAYRYKLLLDLDGMGYSARALGFYASKSAVIKSTVYKEYFEDWIEPWVHFIPLSNGFDELFNIWAYFIGLPPELLDPDAPPGPIMSPGVYDADGDAALKSIADASRKWKREHARRADMEVYLYRLCLEWARLWYKDTENMDYVPQGV